MENLDTLMEKYVEKFSNPPYFTIPSSDYDEYKECQKLVKTQLKLQFKRVIDFISENNLYETWDEFLYRPNNKLLSPIKWEDEPLKVQLTFKPI